MTLSLNDCFQIYLEVSNNFKLSKKTYILFYHLFFPANCNIPRFELIWKSHKINCVWLFVSNVYLQGKVFLSTEVNNNKSKVSCFESTSISIRSAVTTSPISLNYHSLYSLSSFTCHLLYIRI